MHWVYHWSWRGGENNEGAKIVESDIEYQKLLSSKEWFDSPARAWEFYFLYKNIYWTVKQACFLLAGQNPWPASQCFSSEAKFIYNILDTAYQAGNLKLIEQKNIFNENELKATNVNFIKVAIKFKLPIQEFFLIFLNKITKETKKPSIIPDDATKIMSMLGKKGASENTKRHRKVQALALRIARKAWRKCPTKTKEDVAAVIFAELQSKGIKNGKELYSSKTIEKWIKKALPKERKKGGKPKRAQII